MRAASPIQTSDTVFCPLLKAWVKRGPEMPQIKAPLDRICAPTESKLAFFVAASKRYALIKFVPNSEAAEKLFFRYLQRGKQVLSELSPLPGGSTPQSALAAAQEQKTASNFDTDFGKERAESFAFARLPRPPNSAVSDRFTTSRVSALDTTPRNDSPRGPPFFI